MKDVQVDQRLQIETPFGPTSDPVDLGSLAGGAGGLPVQARRRPPAAALGGPLPGQPVGPEVPRGAGGDLVSPRWAACRPGMPPGTLRLPDQFIDRTCGRVSSFFGEGLVAHVALADPTCPWLRARLLEAGRAAGLPVEDGGTYVCMEGPGFLHPRREPAAPGLGRRLHRHDPGHRGQAGPGSGALLRHRGPWVTDYDSWREEEAGAMGTDIFATISANIEKSRQLLRQVVPALAEIPACACQSALKSALVTPPDRVPEATRRKLALAGGQPWLRSLADDGEARLPGRRREQKKVASGAGATRPDRSGGTLGFAFGRRRVEPVQLPGQVGSDLQEQFLRASPAGDGSVRPAAAGFPARARRTGPG